MMVASNFRFTARQALRGNWGISVLTLFVAGLLGASVTNVVTYTYNSSTSRTTFTDLSRFASDLFTGDFFYFMSYAAATVTAFAFVVMLYSLFRFANEFFRGDYEWRPGGLTPAQWICLLILPVGIVLWRCSGRRPQAPGDGETA